MQIKLIFTRKVVHLASFWKWGFLERGSGLLLVNREGVFERCTSTGSEAFSFIIWLDAYKFVLLSVFTLKHCSWIIDEKDPLPVDVRRSKTSLLKLPVTIPEAIAGHISAPVPLSFLKWRILSVRPCKCFYFKKGNSHNEGVFCECSLVPHDSLVTVLFW